MTDFVWNKGYVTVEDFGKKKQNEVLDKKTSSTDRKETRLTENDIRRNS